MYKLMIVDDSNIIRRKIERSHNATDFELVGSAANGQEALQLFKTLQPDVLTMDLTMPEMDGIEVLKTFKKRNINIKTIILSSLSAPKLVQEIVHLGANGFIDKSCASDHIIDAVRNVHKGKQYFSDDIKTSLLELYVTEATVEEPVLSDSDLNEREIEVLKLIASEKSSTEIAEILLVSIKTVETYRKSLYKKLKVKNVVGLAMYAVKNNIV